MMTLKLDKSALETLFDTPEARVQLTHAVLHNFLDRHLKAVENSPAIHRYLAEVRKGVEAEALKVICAEVGEIKSLRHLDPSIVRLVEPLREEIASQVRTRLREMVREQVESSVSAVSVANIKTLVERLVTETVNRRVKEEVEARLQQIKETL